MKAFIIKYTLTLGLLSLLLIIGGCTSTPSTGSRSESAVQGAFRHRWWNYYARGLSAAEHRNYAGAFSDIQTALQKRDRDQYMARTYGMHFVDYFPHRELGILFWEMRQLDAARAHLEMSISQTPTAKAVYYLDRVREERIRRHTERDAVRVHPPDIRLTLPEEGILTSDDPVVITGTVSDSNYVDVLEVGGKTVFLDGARRVVDFRQTLDLPHGRHRVAINAGSLSGLSNEKIVTVNVDRQGPVIDVQSVATSADGAKHHRVLIGRAIDSSGVTSLMVNQSAVRIPSGSTIPFRIPLDQPRAEITVSASDRLGNVTHVRFNLRDIDAVVRPSASVLLACRVPIRLAASRSPRADRQAPTIRLKGWTASQTVYMDKVVIEGSAGDDRQLSRISVNGRSVGDAALTGVLAAFNTCVSLEEGPNVISIEAVDAAGYHSVKKITIVRRNPKARLLNERLSVGILPFALHGESSTTSDAFQDLFLQQLDVRKRFKLVDRALLDIILQELKINRTDLIASGTALQMGRLAAADTFVSGSIIETRMGTEVISRMVDAETAEVLTIVDAFIEKKETLNDIRGAAEQLSLKFHREFPMVDGKILELKQENIVTDLGDRELRAQRRILVVEELPVLHPVTQHRLGFDYKVMGRARLELIQKDFSRGKLKKGCDPAIRMSHRVVTQ